jgi:pentose-5-phosphate-3-epimerase
MGASPGHTAQKLNVAMMEAAVGRGLVLSGSLLAVPSFQRVAAAEQLWVGGGWAHADVIDARFGTRPSVSLADIWELSMLNPERTEVHLMVEDPIAWCERLPFVQRVSVQLHDGLDIPAVTTAVRRVAAELWWAVDGVFASGGRLGRLLSSGFAGSAPEGILVLTVPPGREGFRFDPSRLADVRLVLPVVASVGVDGGVMAAHLDEISRAGAGYVVSGRHLFDEPQKNGPSYP